MTKALTIRPIPIEAVNQFFPLVREYIVDGLVDSDLSFSQVKVFLATGAWQLLVAFDCDGQICGAYTLSVVNAPNDRTATIVTAGGKGLAAQDCFDQVCRIAAHFGATKIQALASEAAARLYRRVGLMEKSRLLEKKL